MTSETRESRRGLLCPSYPTETATHLLGTVLNGQLHFKSPPVPVAAAVDGASLELTTTLRFAGPCIQAQCDKWEGRCTLGDWVAELDPLDGSQWGACPIQDRCRWRHENGVRACESCASVTYVGIAEPATDLSP